MRTEPTPKTQAARILNLLRERPVCQSEMYRTDGVTHRLAARIYDLRHLGWTIESETCRLHRHTSPVVVYRLVHH